MSANAASVAARVTDTPAPIGPGVARHDFRLGSLVERPVFTLVALGLGLALTAGIAAFQGDDGRHVLAEKAGALDVLANLVAHEAAALGAEAARTPAGVEKLVDTLPTGSLPAGRWLLVADEHDIVVATAPVRDGAPRRLSDLLARARPVSGMPDQPWLVEFDTPSDGRSIATIRRIPSGHVAIVQAKMGAPSTAAALRKRAGALLPFSGALLLLGAGCLGLARRARKARLACGRLQTRLELSLARARCGLWDWDLDRDEVFWSPSMYAMLGYEARSEPLSLGAMSAIVRLPEGDIRDFADRFGSAETGGPVDHEVRVRSASREWLWFRLRAEIVADPEDGRRHLVGVAVDITEERAAAERSAMEDARLREALEAISEAFVLWDADHKLVLCNSKFQELHGLPAELVQPGSPYAAVIEAARPTVAENRLASGYPQHPHARTIDKQLTDGRWIHINERRTRDGGFVSVGTDITPLKQKEEKLLGSERRLTASVQALKQSRKVLQIQAQRLAELAERNHDERARAELASRAKTDFLAKMSHELRTPLNAIIGFADMMRNEVLGPLGCPRYGEYTNDIHASGLGLLSSIDHILTASRLDAGHVRLVRAPVDLARIGESAQAAVAREANSKGLSVIVDIDPSLVVSGDAAALREVLAQLMQNAVRFTEPGGAVRVRCRQAGDAVNLFVADSGVGIPSEFLERLGRPFEGAETEYSRSQCGSGLGLAIAGALVRLHDGSLKLRSQEGAGTIALVHLPCSPAVANDLTSAPTENARKAPYLIAAE